MRPHHVLDVVAEDEEEEHVPEDVQPARVHENIAVSVPSGHGTWLRAAPMQGPLTAQG